MKGGKKPPTDRSTRAGNKEDNIVPDNLRPSDQIQLENERVVDVVFDHNLPLDYSHTLGHVATFQGRKED
jgi:hypothetical protein